MIKDQLTNNYIYKAISKNIAIALNFLEVTDFTTIADGKYELPDSDLFALISTYNTIPFKEGVWEAHKKYIDVQFIVRGREEIGIARADDLTIFKEYDPLKDCIKFRGDGNLMTAVKGDFFIFYPQDVHLPGVYATSSSSVKKVVIKVPL